MTALDSAVPLRPARTARRDAEKVAGSLVRRVRRTGRAWLAVAVVALLVAGTGVVLGIPVLLMGVPVAMLALYVRAALADAQRRGPTPRDGTSLHVLFERGVHEHLAQLAADIGVRCPTEVYVVAEPEVRLSTDPDEPMLCIGSSVLWHFDVSELDRLVAGPVSAMRAVADPEVRPGLILASRLDCDRLTGDSTTVVGGVVRRLGRRLETDRAALLDAVQEWGDGSVPRRLRPTAADEAELYALREVEELEAARRSAAAEAGVAVRLPSAGAMATLAACELAGALEPRSPRVVLRPASSLLTDPAATDRRLAERLAARVGEGTALVARDELPTRVWMDVWRRERDRGLPVVVHLTGRWPRTLAELFGVLGNHSTHRPEDAAPVDRVPLLGSLLTRRPQQLSAGESAGYDTDGEQQWLDAVVELVAASVRVVLVEQGRAHPGWDDLWGARLLDPDGEVLSVDACVADAVARRDARGLLAWLSALEVDIEQPWNDSEPPEGGLDGLPIAVLTAEYGVAGSRRGPDPRRADVVILDGWLLGYPHPEQNLLGTLLGRLRSQAAGTRELLRLARTNRHQLVEVAEPDLSLRLVDVTSARLDGRTDGSGWWLRLEAPDRHLELTGRGSATEVAGALQHDLGDRLTRSGSALPGLAATTSWTARLSRLAAGLVASATLVGASAVLLGVAPARHLPGTGAWEHAVAVLVIGSALVLACRLAQGAGDRTFRRRADPLRLPAPRARARSTAAD